MSVHERPIYKWLEFIKIRLFNYQIGVRKKGPYYVQITQNLLLYLRMFHEWGPLYAVGQ